MTEEIEKQAREYANKEVHHSQILGERNRLNQAFQDGAKWGMEHAIEWHDMIANPDDLPKKTDEYWVKYSDGSYGIATYFADGSNYHDYIWRCLIAWCELPQFKDKE